MHLILLLLCSTDGVVNDYNLEIVQNDLTDTEVMLQWSPSTGKSFDWYNIEASISSDPVSNVSSNHPFATWHCVAMVPTISSDASSSVIRGRVLNLKANTKYQFRVGAQNVTTKEDETDYSSPIEVTTKDRAITRDLFGQKCFTPPMTKIMKEAYLLEYNKAKILYKANPSELNTVWFARMAGFLYYFEEAFAVLKDGIKRFPESERMYRHLGHRYISIRQFADAKIALTKSRELVQGKPAEPEYFPPEFKILPIPESSVQMNIYYHLALSNYLLGNYSEAVKIWIENLPWSTTKYDVGNDSSIAVANWLYMAYRREGGPDAEKQAQILLNGIDPDESHYKFNEGPAYFHCLLFYKGLMKEENLLKGKSFDVSIGAYGIGNYKLYNDKNIFSAQRMFQLALGLQNWALFGAIAAEKDLLDLDNIY